MSPHSPFGRSVRERRRALDLTQEELARRVGCAAVTVRKIEAEELRASQQIAERLAVALAIPLEERGEFVRAARGVRPGGREPTPPPATPAPVPAEIGAEDLSGRAIRGYALGEKIGSGGFGVVYRAVQPLVDREVAIKIILPAFADRPDFIRRFEAEAQLVGRLEHPHIVPLYDYWREPGAAYLVMRLLRGGSLHGRLQRGPLEPMLVARVLQQVGAALHAAHRQGVVHRDLKPANVLLDEEGNAYLADFGIAKQLANPDASATQEGLFIGSPAYSSPEQLRLEGVTAQTDIYCLGIMLYELLTGRRPFEAGTPLELAQQQLREPTPGLAIHRSGLPEALDAVIQRATAKLPGARFADVLELTRAFEEAINHSLDGIYAVAVPAVGQASAVLATAVPTQILDLPDADNPYKGLRAFDEADSGDFYGREALVQQLLGRMAEGSELARFLAVIGPSGSGKSSVVRAGLVPALRRGGLPGSEHWFIVAFTPGAHPLEELEAALLKIAPATVGQATGERSLLAQLSEGGRGLIRAARRVLPSAEPGELVLVIDQFEEVFTLVEQESERTQLLNLLVAAALDESSRVRVIVTLRADFLDRPLRYVDFAELLKQRSEMVLPLNPDELERAISEPAYRAGLRLEDGLVGSIVHEVAEQPGALPLLQYALSELYAQREGRLLTRAAYRSIGGATGALSQRAEALFVALNAAEQEACRQLFLRLVTPGEGVEDTRRRARMGEIGNWRLGDWEIGAFGKARLLTFDRDPLTRETTVEVAHEALIRSWPRLRGWLNESREELRIQRRLFVAANEWQAAGRDKSFLASGARLDQFAGLDLFSVGTQGQIALNAVETEYLTASIGERERQEQHEQARQAQELAQARRAASAQRSAANRLRYLVVGLALFLLVASGLSAFAFQQRGVAEASAAEAATNLRRSEALRLGALAATTIDGQDSELTALLALRSLRETYSPQADAALLSAYNKGKPERTIKGLCCYILALAVTPDGRYLFTANTGTVSMWDVETGELIRHFPDSLRAVTDMQVSPNGRYLLVGESNTPFARLYEIATGVEVAHLGYTNMIGVAFSPDSSQALTLSKTGRATVWDLATGQEKEKFDAFEEGLLAGSVAFSPDGQQIAIAGSNNTAQVWSLASKEMVREFIGHAGTIWRVGFTPDGQQLFTASSDHTARIWDVGTGEAMHVLGGHSSSVFAAVATPDGRRLVTGSCDGSARIWDIETGSELRSIPVSDCIIFMGMANDGSELFLPTIEATVQRWRLDGAYEPVSYLVGERIADLAVSQDGNTLAATTYAYLDAEKASQISMFDVLHPATLKEVLPIKGLNISFNSDSSRLLASGTAGNVYLWDVAAHLTRREFPSNDIQESDISADGSLVLIGLPSGAQLWNAANGKFLRTFKGHEGNVFTVDLSSDGRLAITGGQDGIARVWNTSNGSLLQSLAGHTGALFAVGLSPDGKRAITGGSDTTMHLWDVATGEQVHVFGGHTGSIFSVAFSPDGRKAISGSADRTARLWNLETTLIERVFADHESPVQAVAFAPEGEHVYTTGGVDIKRWRIDLSRIMDEVCASLSRDFSPAERVQYGIPDDRPTCPAR
jgi:WD40 repeat protein/transcriptional regulator with XRE-family HTH domain